ncbi:MAG: citrate/2-methylcitrate synthase [Rhodothermales bacterium]|nr:citrate/2-methylcitrate synthase [Rhodothermales bacterium]MDG2017281.1 citrate/2-methylcitrate synthase [Rhodothermales bacterium]
MSKSQNKSATPSRGLEGVIALDTAICDIDGTIGRLVYSGYDIRDLARNTSFEEVAYLLWNGALPESHQLEHLKRSLDTERTLPPMVKDVLAMTPEDANPMAVLRTAVSALALFDGEADDAAPAANYRKSVRLTARIPTILAHFDRVRNGLDPQHPLRDRSTAANFLYMLHGKEPSEAAEKAFDACLVLHAEHGLNASTFAGRVIGATLTDMYSAISGAIGALKGPLHGGANIAVMEMLLKIDRSGADPRQWVKEKLARKERIMGFGHRVYKTIDPRATILKEMMDQMSASDGSRKWYDMSLQIKEVVEKEKGLYPNVDFFSASVYGTLGIPMDLFTPIFAMARITGWTAHLLEQWKENRLIRPRAAYAGPADRSTSS